MERHRKQKTIELLRLARPTVHVDQTFVDRLHKQLQQRTTMIARERAVPHAPAKTSRWWFGTLSLGAVTAIVAVIVILPSWLSSPTTIRGYIQKGPFISGSEISVQELDNRLQPTGKNYQVATGSDFGDYTLRQDIGSSYVEVIARGFYYDEVRGSLSSAPLTLRAIAEVSEDRVVNVNVLTTLASPRIRYLVGAENRSFTEAKQQAQQDVLKLFKITTEEASGFEKMNISRAGQKNGILLAVSALLQGKQAVAEVSELLSKLSLDLQNDGVVKNDSPLLSTLEDNASQLNTTAIRENLQLRFQELSVEATVPEFESWLEPFSDTAEPFTYRITLMDNVFGVNRTSGATIKVTIYGDGFEKNQEEVSLKNLLLAKIVNYVNEHTLVAEFEIDQLSAGSYTVVVRNTTTGRTGVTDGEPLEDEANDIEHKRLILRGYSPKITSVTPSVSYLNGGTITIRGQNFAYGSFVWINDWQVPEEAVRIANATLMHVDLSPALIANNSALPRKENLTITVQTPDFQTASYSGFQIR